MEFETLRVEQHDGVVVITLNRPEVMNALNSQMRREIAYVATEAPESGRVLAIVGSGKAFCSGQDLGDRVDASNVNLERTLREEYFPMLDAIKDCPIPTVCAVNGAAAGAGANLALAADVVVAAESAYFVQAFSRIGLIPDAGGTWLLPRKVGLARSMGASLFAEKIAARQAAEWGMIWESVPDAEFEEHWQGRALQLARGPTEAYKRIKLALRASFSNDFESQLRLEAKLQGEAGKTRDFQEGVLAFVEKRKPEFEGR
ncbi:MAG: enoyl-CoA hydratase-related protein [Albidovulum sp.]|nr:enoyl-CoA hydratase-related protein [Albidovulum sp.]MDE0305529.1 enoyl-CoA hydratase-related protein [Albidovulum sp.]MDE0533432.1 enoyl-CoA hydratase-related protein [Albidovulum sp.]